MDQLDYYGKLSAQLDWQRSPHHRPVRIVYTQAGEPTGSLLEDSKAIVESAFIGLRAKRSRKLTIYWRLSTAKPSMRQLKPLMSKGQFGARDLHKQLWKLPIPEFNPTKPLHSAIADSGEAAAEGTANQLARLREERGPKLTVTIARRELRAWLHASAEGQAVEKVVGRLLQGG